MVVSSSTVSTAGPAGLGDTQAKPRVTKAINDRIKSNIVGIRFIAGFLWSKIDDGK
jgi:hypothetical protein